MEFRGAIASDTQGAIAGVALVNFSVAVTTVVLPYAGGTGSLVKAPWAGLPFPQLVVRGRTCHAQGNAAVGLVRMGGDDEGDVSSFCHAHDV